MALARQLRASSLMACAMPWMSHSLTSSPVSVLDMLRNAVVQCGHHGHFQQCGFRGTQMRTFLVAVHASDAVLTENGVLLD